MGQFVEFLTSGAPYAWPLMFLAISICFREPLTSLVTSIATFFERARKISTRFGDFEADEASAAVIEREELRLAALIATAGRESASKEIFELRSLALKFGAYNRVLKEDQVKYLLNFAFNLAMANGNLEEEEKKVLLLAGQAYGWPGARNYIESLEKSTM